MALLKLSAARTRIVYAPDYAPAGTPALTKINKAGGGWADGINGSTATWDATHKTLTIVLAAGDTDTLGDLAMFIDDGMTNTYVVVDEVVTDLPGDTVQSVQGTVTVGNDSIANALLDLPDAVETGLTVRQAMKLLLAVLGGKVSGARTGTEVFRNAVADSKDRVTVTVDALGNRSAVATDLT